VKALLFPEKAHVLSHHGWPTIPVVAEAQEVETTHHVPKKKKGTRQRSVTPELKAKKSPVKGCVKRAREQVQIDEFELRPHKKKCAMAYGGKCHTVRRWEDIHFFLIFFFHCRYQSSRGG